MCFSHQVQRRLRAGQLGLSLLRSRPQRLQLLVPTVSWLAGQGLPTTVYSHAASLSKRLNFAATTVVTSITTTTAMTSIAPVIDLPIRRSI